MKRHPRKPETIISKNKLHWSRNYPVRHVYEPIDPDLDLYTFYKLMFTHTHKHLGIIWYNYEILESRQVRKTLFFDDDIITE